MKYSVEIQNNYYKKTANNYDDVHINETSNEHKFALLYLSTIIKMYNVKSILDVGAGTGRTIEYIKSEFPNIIIIGIEPVKELRDVGHKKGISKDMLVEGDGYKINFENSSFDIVCEFGVLHHVEYPEKVVKEMLRVSKIGVFISDSNNFGHGSRISRFIKQSLNFLKLWKVFQFIITKGKMYQISEGDGLYYSYSVFNNYKLLKKHCKLIHITNTIDGSINPYKTASHIALFGLK